MQKSAMTEAAAQASQAACYDVSHLQVTWQMMTTLWQVKP